MGNHILLAALCHKGPSIKGGSLLAALNYNHNGHNVACTVSQWTTTHCYLHCVTMDHHTLLPALWHNGPSHTVTCTVSYWTITHCYLHCVTMDHHTLLHALWHNGPSPTALCVCVSRITIHCVGLNPIFLGLRS